MHDLGAADPYFAERVIREVLARLGVNDLSLRIRQRWADGPPLYPVHWVHVGGGGGLRQSVRLADGHAKRGLSVIPQIWGSSGGAGNDQADGRRFGGTGMKTPMKGLELFKPAIAAINGFCLGGGMELAMVCDIRVASDNAVFGQPEIKRGIFPGMGATQRLPRLMPYNIAAEILFTGEHFDAQEAYRIGFVNRVVPQDELLDSARGLAETLAAQSPLSMRALNEALLASTRCRWAKACDWRAFFRIVGDTHDAKEGMRAFVEQRPPEFKGQ